MIKLNLPREPHWITLAAGVRLQVRVDAVDGRLDAPRLIDTVPD